MSKEQCEEFISNIMNEKNVKAQENLDNILKRKVRNRIKKTLESQENNN